MLGNLDNEVIFKKAFTNITVFKAFVRDILGIEVEIDKIETEKKFEPKISPLTPEGGNTFNAGYIRRNH